MLLQVQDNTTGLFAAEIAERGPEIQRGNWYCRLAEIIIGDFLIIPLTSRKKIHSEAYMMSNCCRQYTAACAALEYVLFSVRSRAGERQATLGLRREEGHYHFDQCFGPANMEVMEESLCYCDENDVIQTESYPTEIYYVAQEVVRLMNAPAPEVH